MKLNKTILKQLLATRINYYLLLNYRSKEGSNDCIAPFSGGRDSTFTLHYLKKRIGHESNCFYI